MVDSEMLAGGSVSGKHFKRCKRLHPMVALGLQILHFNSELEISIKCKKYLQEFKTTSSTCPDIRNEELNKVFEKYDKYTKETISGGHGVTRQYYVIYINHINYYLILNNCIRTSNFEVFKLVFLKISN